MPPKTAVAAEALRSVRREKLIRVCSLKEVCCCYETQTYTNVRRKVICGLARISLIAVGPSGGNIGFQMIRLKLPATCGRDGSRDTELNPIWQELGLNI